MIREERYGEVRAFEVARSLAGRAIWTVRLFLLGKVLIDTGPPNMRRPVLDLARRLHAEAALLTNRKPLIGHCRKRSLFFPSAPGECRRMAGAVFQGSK